MIARALIVAATVLVATGMYRPVRSQPASGADSVDVLLLATPPVSTLHLTTRSDSPERPTLVTAIGDSLSTGEITRAMISSVGRQSIRSGRRSRDFDGTLTLRARGGRIVAVARIAVEDYLAGVVAAEAGARDPEAYLVALLVLQRNYVDAHRGRHRPDADLCDNTHCQLYHGAATRPRLRALVGTARGYSLGEEGVRPCYYSANCGGSTLTPGQVWGGGAAGYAAVACADCRNARWHRWTREVKATPTAVALLGSAPAAPFVDDHFKIRAGRALGFDVVPSNTVDALERRGGRFVIRGRGFGHRVGLCQDGARRMALDGRSAAGILRHYFPTATLVAPASGLDAAED